MIIASISSLSRGSSIAEVSPFAIAIVRNVLLTSGRNFVPCETFDSPIVVFGAGSHNSLELPYRFEDLEALRLRDIHRQDYRIEEEVFGR